MNDSETPVNPPPVKPESAGEAPAPIPPKRPIRWWPVVVILSLAVVLLLVTWSNDNLQRQDRFLRTILVGILSAGLLLGWVLFLSRMAWRIRLVIFGGVVLLAIVAKWAFVIRGVSGDLIPIIGLRGQSKESQALATTPVVPAAVTSTSAIDTTPTPLDFPQFAGPNRDCSVQGPALARDWMAQPPQEIWRVPVGPAWSGFAIVGQVAVTQEQRGEQELVIAYDLRSGKPLWSHADAGRYSTTIAGEGPRATPTIHDGRVYALGATGRLNSLELASGKLIWSAEISPGIQSKDLEWGMSSSPLVLDGQVIVAPFRKNVPLAAYAIEDGEPLWSAEGDGASYGSPYLATLAGVPQLLSFNKASVTAHQPGDGKLLWKHPWKSGNPHVALPVVLDGGRVFFSCGYGVGGELLEVKAAGDGLSVSRVWKSLRMKAKFTNVIHQDGSIYGLDDGIMACIDAATGDLRWKDGRYGHGQILLRNGLLVVMCENGDVALVEPSPGELKELGRFTALRDKTWNPHALSGDLLLVRNHKEAACFRLPLAR